MGFVYITQFNQQLLAPFGTQFLVFFSQMYPSYSVIYVSFTAEIQAFRLYTVKYLNMNVIYLSCIDLSTENSSCFLKLLTHKQYIIVIDLMTLLIAIALLLHFPTETLIEYCLKF